MGEEEFPAIRSQLRSFAGKPKNLAQRGSRPLHRCKHPALHGYKSMVFCPTGSTGMSSVPVADSWAARKQEKQKS